MKGYPFEVVLPAGLPIAGAVLAHQVKTIDRQARRIEAAGLAPDEVVRDVGGKVRALLKLP